MKITLLLLAVATLVGLVSAREIPRTGPSLEYELINPGQGQLKPFNDQTTLSPNKTFSYDPLNRTWKPVKASDPEPKEGTLLWNQNNDKWLTQAFVP